jgi:hypothetical protein
MFLFSHPCQCDLGSNNCSGSKGTVTAVRHLLKDGLFGPEGKQAAPPRPKQPTLQSREQGTCPAKRCAYPFVLSPHSVPIVLK